MTARTILLCRITSRSALGVRAAGAIDLAHDSTGTAAVEPVTNRVVRGIGDPMMTPTALGTGGIG